MKRNLFVYVSLPIVSAFFLAFGVWMLAIQNTTGDIVIGAFLLAFSVFVALVLMKIVMQDNLNIRCGTLCAEKKYDEERALIERKMKSPFFFLVRIVAIKRYIRASMALDDLPTAKRYIDVLRHGGGAGWKYMTAYCYILIKLDEGDFKTARTEFEEFRAQCAHAEIYRDQIETLAAIFHRVYGTNNAEPLPKSAVDSPFPVIGRILGKIYEERFAGTEWE